MPRMGKQTKAEKPVNMKKSIGKLFRYIKSYIPLVVISVILIVVSTVFRLVGPNKLGEITTIISNSIKSIFDGTFIAFEMSDIMDIGIFLIILYAVGAVITYIANVLMGTVCHRMSKNLRNDISKKINKVPLKFLDRTPYGDVLSCVTNDVDMIGQTLHQSASSH